MLGLYRGKMGYALFAFPKGNCVYFSFHNNGDPNNSQNNQRLQWSNEELSCYQSTQGSGVGEYGYEVSSYENNKVKLKVMVISNNYKVKSQKQPLVKSFKILCQIGPR